ncbi:MAG: hypothetical protein ACI9MC_002753 [Kiritimatiellia bacterium]|jgi:hypothetical protein
MNHHDQLIKSIFADTDGTAPWLAEGQLKGPTGQPIAQLMLARARSGNVWEAIAEHPEMVAVARARRGPSFVESLLTYAESAEDHTPSPSVRQRTEDIMPDEADPAFNGLANQIKFSERRAERGRQAGVQKGIQKGERAARAEALREALLATMAPDRGERDLQNDGQ